MYFPFVDFKQTISDWLNKFKKTPNVHILIFSVWAIQESTSET